MGLASWWDETVVPRIIRCGCGMEMITELRRQVIPLAQGQVFELGCGAGANLPLYDPARVSSYTSLEPSPKLLEMARAVAAEQALPAHISPGLGEDLPYADDSFDSVVCTFTLCSVNDPARVLSELRRVLKPGGNLLFAEHGRSPDERVARWQERVDPLWRRLCGNCHLSRPVEPSIREAGFEVQPIGAGYQDGPRIASWMEWGVARKRG